MGNINGEIMYAEMRDRIFLLLAENHLTQKDLAEKLQISSQTVTDWKKGKSNSFSRMSLPLASILHTSPSWLLWGIGDRYVSDETRAKMIREEEEKLQRLAIESRESEAEANREMQEIFKDKFGVMIQEFDNILDNPDESIAKKGLTLHELQLILRYRMADEKIRQIVDLLLEKRGLAQELEEKAM